MHTALHCRVNRSLEAFGRMLVARIRDFILQYNTLCWYANVALSGCLQEFITEAGIEHESDRSSLAATSG
jgi:hypothetical protein